MKKLLTFLAKINFHFITIIIFSLSFFTGRFIPLLIYFFITSIHELSHLIVAKIFKLTIKQIDVYPFGLSLKLDSLNKLHPFKSILILIAGPLSYFVSLFLLKLLYLFNVLSYNSYLYSLDVNKLIFFFNLLPIWPLDGAKILFFVMSFFITLKKCYYFVISLSVICTVSLVFLTINDPQLVIITFLVLSQIEFIINYSIDYYKTLAFRVIKTPNYRIKVHSKNDIYLPYENVHFNDIIFVDERYLINDILNRKKV